MPNGSVTFGVKAGTCDSVWLARRDRKLHAGSRRDISLADALTLLSVRQLHTTVHSPAVRSMRMAPHQPNERNTKLDQAAAKLERYVIRVRFIPSAILIVM
jgi:hypothetical protein